MKNTKKIAITLALAFTLLLPISAFAGTTDTSTWNPVRIFCGTDTTKLTDAQKTDLLNSWKKMMDAKKDAVNTMVANKTITAAEGAAYIKSIDDMIKYRTENGFTTGTGRMNGSGTGSGMMNGKGRGNRSGLGNTTCPNCVVPTTGTTN